MSGAVGTGAELTGRLRSLANAVGAQVFAAAGRCLHVIVTIRSVSSCAVQFPCNVLGE